MRQGASARYGNGLLPGNTTGGRSSRSWARLCPQNPKANRIIFLAPGSWAIEGGRLDARGPLLHPVSLNSSVAPSSSRGRISGTAAGAVGAGGLLLVLLPAAMITADPNSKRNAERRYAFH